MNSYIIEGLEHSFEKVFYKPKEELHYTIKCKVGETTKTYQMAKDKNEVWRFCDSNFDVELEIKFNKIILNELKDTAK